jgi:hypothetical protein
MEWLAENWYVAWGLFCLAVLVVVGIYYWRNPEAPGARIYFRMFPLGDPTGETPTGFTNRALMLWLFGLFILLLVYLFVPGYS